MRSMQEKLSGVSNWCLSLNNFLVQFEPLYSNSFTWFQLCKTVVNRLWYRRVPFEVDPQTPEAPHNYQVILDITTEAVRCMLDLVMFQPRYVPCVLDFDVAEILL